MKNYEEIANSVFERRDAYVTRQKQKRRTAMKIASATCAFALVALGAFGVAKSGWLTPDTPPVDDPAVTVPTDITNNPDAVGGDVKECIIHSPYYHIIPGEFDDEAVMDYVEHYLRDYEASPGDCPEAMCTIVEFVQWADISRAEFIEAMEWGSKNLDEKINDTSGNRYCPYTYNQFLDAIYGDDEELAEWVFAPLSSWPEIEEPAE